MNMKNMIPVALCTFLAVAYSNELNSTALITKIIGGEYVTQGTETHTVVLKFDDVVFCGGALISTSHVLTAARCVYKLTRSLFHKTYVEVGSVSSKTNGIRHYIHEIIIHEDFNPRLPISPADISVICLNSTVVLSSYVSVISLSNQVIGPGFPATVTGWGATEHHSRDVLHQIPMSDRLKKLRMITLSNRYCSSIYRGRIHDSLICTASLLGRHETTSTGDGGGPLVHSGKLIGVASFISRLIPVPCIFTRVSFYHTFIISVMYPSCSEESISETEDSMNWSYEEDC